MSNIVELGARRREASAAKAAAKADTGDSVRALQDLQELCGLAIAAGRMDEMMALDFTVAVHRALKGSAWSVRFHREKTAG